MTHPRRHEDPSDFDGGSLRNSWSLLQKVLVIGGAMAGLIGGTWQGVVALDARYALKAEVAQLSGKLDHLYQDLRLGQLEQKRYTVEQDLQMTERDPPSAGRDRRVQALRERRARIDAALAACQQEIQKCSYTSFGE